MTIWFIKNYPSHMIIYVISLEIFNLIFLKPATFKIFLTMYLYVRLSARSKEKKF